MYGVSCAPPAAEHASYVVALVGVSGYTARVALPYDAAATTLRLFGLPDGGAAPLAGPAAGGTLLRLQGFGFDATDSLTCTFTYDTSTSLSPHSQPSCLFSLPLTPTCAANVTVVPLNVTSVRSAWCATPALPAGAVASVALSTPDDCAAPGLSFRYYAQPAVLLALPRAGPRYGPNALMVYPSAMFYARQLAAAAAAPGGPPANLSCLLEHAATGARTQLPAVLAEGGAALRCVTSQVGPLAAGNHTVSVSFNGVDFAGASAVTGAAAATFAASGPVVALGATSAAGSQSTGDELALPLRLTGPASLAAVRATLRLEAAPGPGGSAPAQSGVDYEVLNASTALTWPPGDAQPRFLRLRLLRRPGVLAPPKTLRVVLASASNADLGDATSALVTLTSEEPAPMYAVFAARAAYRGDTPAGGAYLEVAPLGGGSAVLPTSVAFTLGGGTATPGVHYAPASGVLTWQPLDAEPQRIGVAVAWDAFPLSSAFSVGVTLTAVANARVVGGGNATSPEPLWLYGVPRDTCPPGTRVAALPPTPPAPPAPPPANPRATLAALSIAAFEGAAANASAAQTVRRAGCLLRNISEARPANRIAACVDAAFFADHVLLYRCGACSGSGQRVCVAAADVARLQRRRRRLS